MAAVIESALNFVAYEPCAASNDNVHPEEGSDEDRIQWAAGYEWGKFTREEGTGDRPASDATPEFKQGFFEGFVDEDNFYAVENLSK